MAFEQFFYNAEIKIQISGEAACSYEENANIFQALGIITEVPEGGAKVGGSASVKSFINPIISGGGVTGSGHAYSIESRPTLGGILVSGEAYVQQIDTVSGNGGIIVSGKAPEEPPVSGGTLVSGSATISIGIVGKGGSFLNGSGNISAVYNVSVSGGVVLNGDAHNIENITVSGGTLVGGDSQPAETAYGGILVGGNAYQTFNEVGSGGVTCSGIAPNGTHDFGSGGILVYGSVIQRITQHIEVSGVIVSGKAPEEPPTSGGILVGGNAYQTFDIISTIGARIGGSAVVGIQPSVSGGIVVNGVSVPGIQPGISGGALLGTGITYSVGKYYVGNGEISVAGNSIVTQPDYNYRPTGEFVQLTQPDPNIYKIKTKHFNYNGDGGLIVSGSVLTEKRFFGQSVPKFSFGKPSVKNEACRSFGYDIRQPAVLAMTRTQTREWLEKLNPDDWSITSFDPKKREVCILIEAGKGITHLITAELILIDDGVGSV